MSTHYEHREALSGADGVRGGAGEGLEHSDRMLARPPYSAPWRSMRLREGPHYRMLARSATPSYLLYERTLSGVVAKTQRAEALEPAASESQSPGFRSTRTLNSGYVPRNDLSSGLRVEETIRLRLTDADAAGCWMGVRL